MFTLDSLSEEMKKMLVISTEGALRMPKTYVKVAEDLKHLCFFL